MLIHNLIRGLQTIAEEIRMKWEEEERVWKKRGTEREREREREREKEMMTMKYVPMYLCIIY